MCDTIIATPAVTKAKVMLFGKNSDREPDEVQNLRIFPAQDHSAKELVDCTYLQIPQVSHTYRVFLSQPFWMFGAEMGVNEHGVVIGNEALMTKLTPGNTGLTGMDLLRLALERADTAKKALDIILTLLETYGQGGNCGYRSKLKYMNGFIIANASEAYVLETIERMWAWKKVETSWAMSNKISLTHDYDAISPDLIPFAIKKGWTKSAENFNFSKAYSDPLITWGAAGKKRELSNSHQLRLKHGELELQDLMQMLRTHTQDPHWTPDRGLRMTVCAHAANNLTRNSESVNSLVVQLDPQNTHFNCYTTGASNPCMSSYFPIFANHSALPPQYQTGKGEFEMAAYWWQMYQFHQKILPKFQKFQTVCLPKLQSFESEMLKATLGHENSQAVIDQWFSKVQQLSAEWEEDLATLPPSGLKWAYQHYWKKKNRLNHVFKHD